MDDFKSQAKQVVRHIPSKYTKEMAQKTEVVRIAKMCMSTAYKFVLAALSIKPQR